MTSELPYFGGEAVRAAVSMDELLDAVEAAYRDVAAGRDQSPLRTHVKLRDGALLLMPGVCESGVGLTAKLVTVMPENAARGLPTIHALVVWFDRRTGVPLALFDGAAVTAMRTGAASGVATRLLAQPEAETLAVLGTGGQAEWQIRGVVAARPIRRALVFSREPESRERFAARMSATLPIQVEAVASAEAAVRSAEVVCCATTSAEPIFDAAWIGPGTHVNGIGAFRLGMIEMPPALFGRAALVAVDAREAALAEAGDVVAAIDSGMLSDEALVEIGSLTRDYAASRDPKAITVFKSVGLAIQDVATVELAARNLLGVGSGPPKV
jgi:ornithine cyclodeaminase/alanine dehydrogenase-like protein (mu-crystallin family)